MANLAIKRLDFRVDLEPLSNPAVIVGLAEVTTTTGNYCLRACFNIRVHWCVIAL